MKTKTLTSLLASAALAFSVGASETNELEKTDNGGLKIEASMDVPARPAAGDAHCIRLLELFRFGWDGRHRRRRP